MAGTHPLFPLNLPTLSANVAQMRCLCLSARNGDELDYIREIAGRIRRLLNEIREDPEETLRWLSVPAYRLEQAAVNMQGQMLVPPEDEVMVNSNLR
jgi:hypothetical protein